MEGWISLYRKFTEWEWYKNSVVKDLFIHLLLLANHKDNRWQGIEIKTGQHLTSIKTLSQELGFSEQQIRTAINKLKSTNEITTKSTNKYTLVTIEKYEFYQVTIRDSNKQNNEQDNKRITNNQQTNNKQITTNNNDNNEISILKQSKKTKKDYSYYGEYQNVFFTKEQFDKLKNYFPKDYEERIQKLDDYIQSSGKKYKDCLATLKTWARKEGYIPTSNKESRELKECTLTEEEYFRKETGK